MAVPPRRRRVPAASRRPASGFGRTARLAIARSFTCHFERKHTVLSTRIAFASAPTRVVPSAANATRWSSPDRSGTDGADGIFHVALEPPQSALSAALCQNWSRDCSRFRGANRVPLGSLTVGPDRGVVVAPRVAFAPLAGRRPPFNCDRRHEPCERYKTSSLYEIQIVIGSRGVFLDERVAPTGACMPPARSTLSGSGSEPKSVVATGQTEVVSSLHIRLKY